MPSPRFGTMANSMYGSIGSLANKILRGNNLHPIAQAAQTAVRNAPAGAGSAALGGFFAAKRNANILMGKKTLGAAAAIGGMGLANRRRPVGGYNPRTPVMPVPKNGQAL